LVYDGGTMLDPAIGALLAGAFALLFLSAALHKLKDLATFRQALGAYRVVPESLLRLAVLFAVAEACAGAGLLAGATRVPAAVLGVLLLVGYAAAIAVNLHRGRRSLSCGCGGANDARAIAPWMVGRNLCLAASLAVLWVPWGARAMDLADALTVGAGTATAAFLYSSLDMLLGRHAAQRARLGVSP
jgi:uncharacterized membrane protein YphA (DoxX/SURF4 family)